MSPNLRSAFHAELSNANAARAAGKREAAWTHLERAHILGQRSTVAHVRAHWRMLVFAVADRDIGEVRGQLVRIIGASLLSRIWVPEGNTGRSSMSAFRSMPIPADLQALLSEDR